MKIAKKAEQKNLLINMDVYTSKELHQMLKNHEIFFLNDQHQISYDVEEFGFWGSYEARIGTSELKEIKVVLDSGWYETVAIGKNGHTYYVTV